MSKIELIVNSLEEKVQSVLGELAELRKDNTTLKEELRTKFENNSEIYQLLKKL